MLKKIIITMLISAFILSFVSCGETKTLHCDGCGIEVDVDADSNMEEDWSIFCSDCEEELGLDTVLDAE